MNLLLPLKLPLKPWTARSARPQLLASAGKSTKTDYGQDWYKSQQSQKDTTIREDLIKAQRLNKEAIDKRDRKDLYTDNWDGDQYKGSRINILTIIVFLFLAVPVLGYAGYAPAKLPPPRPSAIQEALWQIKNTATLKVIATLLKNVVVNPADEKVRRIRLSNPKIESLIKEEKGALQTLSAIGWVPDPDDSDWLVFPKGAQLSMSEVRLVQDAEERLKKDMRTMNRSASASKLPTSEEQARIRKQMEADRLERMSKKAKP